MNMKRLRPIVDIASELKIPPESIEVYGKYMAKVRLGAIQHERVENGKLIVVTAMTPTREGEGKTVIAIGLGQAFRRLGKRAVVCVRQPSMGPTLGIKGGGAGGGLSRLEPFNEINLHFTGDVHAMSAANNLLAALIDNHVYHGNDLGIDRSKIIWKRALDVNDRALRKIRAGLVSRSITRNDAFEITAASEVMATLCLARDLTDLKERLARIIIGYSTNGGAVTAHDLRGDGAMATLLLNAIKPNLVQTFEGSPALVHGGPFGNVAHASPSLISIRLALKLADYAIVEPGFATELGAEKFFDIVCREGGFRPDLALLVITIRAIKHQGGLSWEKQTGDTKALEKGISNVEAHADILRKFGVPIVVVLNRIDGDKESEIRIVLEHFEKKNMPVAVCEAFQKGGNGCINLAKLILTVISKGAKFNFLYKLSDTIEEKINKVATQIYGAKDVKFSKQAVDVLNVLEGLHLTKLSICIAKTQYSISDNPLLLGRPSDFTLKITNLRPMRGPGFIVVYSGTINTMPGLPIHPNAERIYVDRKGRIMGLY